MRAAVKMQAEASGEIFLDHMDKHGFEHWKNKCYICGKPARDYFYIGPGQAAIGLMTHLRKTHEVRDAVIVGWNEDD